jgi:Bax protein
LKKYYSTTENDLLKKTILGFTIVFVLLTFYAAVEMLFNTAQPGQEISAAQENAASVGQAAMTPEERKKHFIEKTLPAIQRVKARLDAQYRHVLTLSKKEQLSDVEKELIERLMQTYKAEGMDCLLRRLHTHPVSIVLAQAALESGWGSSRFYNEANNIFGVWSYNPDEPRLAAGETRGKKTIYVKKYSSLEASIEGYFQMIGRSRAYKDFKYARMSNDNPFNLIAHLTRYSELREEYVKRLYYVIKGNRFNIYDSPSYAPIALSMILPKVERPKAVLAKNDRPPEGDTLLLASATSEEDTAPCDDNVTITDLLEKEGILSIKAKQCATPTKSVAARTSEANSTL